MWSTICRGDRSAPSSVVVLHSWVKISSPSLNAARGDLTAEIIDNELASLDAAMHPRARNGTAHDGDGGRDHVDEGAVDCLNVRTHLRAEEGDCGEVESHLFDRGIKAQVG